MENAEHLARFAALYGDQVLIHNYFLDYAPSGRHAPDSDSHEFRDRFSQDIHVLCALAPLIEAGIVVPFTPPEKYCPQCATELLFGPDARRRYAHAESKLAQTLLAKVNATVSRDTHGYSVLCEGPEDYLEHGGLKWVGASLPDALAEMSSLRKRLAEGKSVSLSKSRLKKLGLLHRIAGDSMYSFQYQVLVAQAIHASFVTHRPSEVDLLQYISTDPDIERRNRIAQARLQMAVPIAGEVPLHALVKLRQREHDSFLRFRAALDKVIRDFQSSGNSITEKAAAELYADVMAPELARLNQKVSQAKSDLAKKPVITVAATVATLAFGIYAGLIPPELVAAAQWLGLSKALLDTLSSAATGADVRREIRQDQFYFLWRLQNSRRRGRKESNSELNPPALRAAG